MRYTATRVLHSTPYTSQVTRRNGLDVTASPTPAVWYRPGLRQHDILRTVAPVDTALFDIDGVLIETARSWRLAVIAAVEVLVRSVNGLHEGPSPLVTPEDIALFKRAGGFNSDWDLARCLAGLWTAMLREWRGQPEAGYTLAEWA